MLAVTLESIYCEQTKERIGTKGNGGKNFDQEEAGRSGEKAARDMGVSRQSVAFAKKVATKGIPELKQMVDTTILAVSTASRVADLDAEDQIKVQAEINKKAQEKEKEENITSRVTSSEVGRIINNILSGGDKKSDTGIDENLASVKQRLNGVIKKLSVVETTTNPEKLAELIALGEQILEIMKAIGIKSQSIMENKEDFAPSQEPEKEPSDELGDGSVEESRRKEVHVIPVRVKSEGDTTLQADQGAISN
jgi:hypothetical protein